MKLSIRKVGLGARFLLMFILGCLVGIGGACFLFQKHVYSKQTDRRADDLGLQLQALSWIRLGEIESLTDDLEQWVDANIRHIALAEYIPMTDYRFKVLRRAKAYREIYPSKSEKASEVNDVLREIPTIDVSRCNKPLCRLVKRAASEERQ